MKYLDSITKEQESELYVFKPDGGFHHKYIFDHSKQKWKELTLEEAKNKIDEHTEKYKKSLLK